MPRLKPASAPSDHVAMRSHTPVITVGRTSWGLAGSLRCTLSTSSQQISASYEAVASPAVVPGGRAGLLVRRAQRVATNRAAAWPARASAMARRAGATGGGGRAPRRSIRSRVFMQVPSTSRPRRLARRPRRLAGQPRLLVLAQGVYSRRGGGPACEGPTTCTRTAPRSRSANARSLPANHDRRSAEGQWWLYQAPSVARARSYRSARSDLRQLDFAESRARQDRQLDFAECRLPC